MSSRLFLCHKSCLVICCCFFVSGLLSAGGFLGPSAEVESVHSGGLAPAPAAAPDVVWVVPFATSMAEVKTDPGGPLKRLQNRLGVTDRDGTQTGGLRGALRESVGGVINGIRGDDESDAPDAVVEKAASALQHDLVSALNKAGIPAQAWTRGANWPSHGLVIDGQFITLDEGSQLRRMVVGLGAGKSYMDVQVQVYDLANPGGIPFMVFYSDGDSGIRPGLLVGGAIGEAVTSAAAVGAGVSGYRASKTGTSDDLKNTATAISEYLDKYWKQNGWLPQEESGKE